MSKSPFCGRWTKSGGVSPSCSSRLQAVMTSSDSLRNQLLQMMSGAGQTASCSVPAGHLIIWHAADRLLDFFLLEKAFYEIEYELAHRPDWLRVPLAGTWRILSRSQG